MKFGVNTFIWASSFDDPQFPLLPQVKERGFDGVEVPLFNAAIFPAAKIRRELERTGLESTVCSVLTRDYSLLSDDADVRRKTRSHMQDCVRAVAELGAGVIAGPLYSPVGYLPGRRRTSDEWKRVVEAYQELGPVLAENKVVVGIEPLNRFETYFLNTAADAVALCDQIGHPSVGILFDTFHANIEEKDVAGALISTRRHLKHLHTCENDRGTPGSGHVPWNDVFRAIREICYDGWLTIESFGFSLGDLSAAASIWRDLASSPEVIAFDGVKFLRENIRASAAGRSA